MYLWLILFKCVRTSYVNVYCFLQGFILLYCFVIYIYIYYILTSQPMFSFSFSLKSTFTFLSTCLDVDSFCFQILWLFIEYQQSLIFFSSLFFPDFLTSTVKAQQLTSIMGICVWRSTVSTKKIFTPVTLACFIVLLNEVAVDVFII